MLNGVRSCGKVSVAIVGGGVAGSTIALRLSELGIQVTLFDKGDSLVSGPPICHLHAGGNLYRELSDEHCLLLLRQSIDTAKVFPQSINRRPTVIAVPKDDCGDPADLLPRLLMLQNCYRELVRQNISNRVLGNPEHYFCVYQRDQLEKLASRPLPDKAKSNDDWLIPVAKNMELDKLKYPVFLVQEHGISAFRFAAIVSLAVEKLPSCSVNLRRQVVAVESNGSDKVNLGEKYWKVSSTDITTGASFEDDFDFVVNACGFRSGELDDMVHARRERLVEFKAAYIAQWPDAVGQWPEVIVHGERGTPRGMAQLTPYADGFFQLHGMTEEVTLFRDGLVKSSVESSQPELPKHFIQKIESHWPASLIEQRTQRSIEHVAQFIPAFATAEVAAKPLYGAQQIPGDDASLRAADLSFHGERYARTEIVKASSALTAADQLLNHLVAIGLVNSGVTPQQITTHYFPVTRQCDEQEVTQRAQQMAVERHYPESLALKLYSKTRQPGAGVLATAPSSFS